MRGLPPVPARVRGRHLPRADGPAHRQQDLHQAHGRASASARASSPSPTTSRAPTCAAAASPRDLRKDEPYCGYENYEFEVPVGKGEFGPLGSCFDRNWVRAVEMAESAKIVHQALDRAREDGEGRRPREGAEAREAGQGRGLRALRGAARPARLLHRGRRHGRQPVPREGEEPLLHRHERLPRARARACTSPTSSRSSDRSTSCSGRSTASMDLVFGAACPAGPALLAARRPGRRRSRAVAAHHLHGAGPDRLRLRRDARSPASCRTASAPSASARTACCRRWPTRIKLMFKEAIYPRGRGQEAVPDRALPGGAGRLPVLRGDPLRRARCRPPT